ncbi:MAG: PDZ domain-containing protein [candidate division WOR-3 bacterium]
MKMTLLTWLLVVFATLALGEEGLTATQKRGWLGVVTEGMSPAMLAALGIDYGVLIAEVVKNSPAAKAGLKMGDVIVSIDGEKITNRGDLIQAVRLRPHKKVEMIILRQLKRQKVIVEIGEEEALEEPEWKQRPMEGIRKLRQMLKQLKPLYRFERELYKEYLDSLRCQIEELQQELRELKRKIEEERR